MPIYRQPFRSDPRKVWTAEQYQHAAELAELIAANMSDPAKLEAVIEASLFRCDSTGQWWYRTGTRKIVNMGDGPTGGKEITVPVTIQVPTPAALEPAPLGKSQPILL